MYAQVASGFLRDCATAGQLDPSQPLYLLEAGSASGRFGYSLHWNLAEILGQSSLSAIRVNLILTDPDESERTFWKEHYLLKALSEAGLFDLANLDVDRDSVLRLELSGRTLSRTDPTVQNEDSFVNPVIVVAGSIDCLGGLRRLCGERLLLLTREPVLPDLLAAYSAETGGTSFFAADSFGAFFLLPGVDPRETGLAFREALEGFNSLDFEAWASREKITIGEYFAHVQRSNHDAVVACQHVDQVVAKIAEAAGEFPSDLNSQMRIAIRRVWNAYYPIGEPEDVPLALAKVVIALGDWKFALELLDASLSLYGESEQRAYMAARCHFQQVDPELASESLEIALASNPTCDEYLSLRTAIAEQSSQRKALEYDQLLDILSKVDHSGPVFQQGAKMLDEYIAPHGYPREPDPGPPKRLTIGMATYDDWDGVYFSVQAIRLFHPEVTDRTEILVVDNHPGSKASSTLADLAKWVKNYRYVAASRPTGTAARDLVFRYSNAEYVLCMDSHVLFAPGSLAALLDYLEANPGTRNLLQGPMVYDDLTNLSTHWDPKWSDGMWGQWGEDKRGTDPSAPPFEIPLQGLGVFACRRDAWLGFNPRFRGFGGEEGHIHEKFRQSGAVTLCLPFLRWIHRFGRPNGVPYIVTHRDSIRNFLLGFHELGLDPAPAIRHFEELLGIEAAREIVETVQKEIRGPFHFFEAIYCINMEGDKQRWDHAMDQFRELGIAEAVQRFPGVRTPHNHHIGCALAHRAVLAEAKRRGLRNILVFEDDVVFAPDALDNLRKSLAELQRLEGMNPWQILYLGGWWDHHRKYDHIRGGEAPRFAPGCRHLELAWVTCTHAIAYSNAVYDRILADVPDNPTEAALWCRKHIAIDRYYLEEFGRSALITSPMIATQMNLIEYETRSFEERSAKP